MTIKMERKKSSPATAAHATRWDEQWMRQYAILSRYRVKHKEGWPSTLEEFPKGNRLGQWVHRQRDLYNGKKLSADRVKQLNRIGFVWDKTDEREGHWMEQIRFLKEFRKKLDRKSVV